jgi:arsenite methyltransferase
MEHKSFCESVRAEIRATYAQVAASAEKHFKYPVGKESARQLGYPREVLQRLPSETSRHFCGVGNPFSIGPLRPGESVLDVGCGAGFDSLVAASLVGPNGSVVGIDLTEAMIHRAQVNLQAVSFSPILKALPPWLKASRRFTSPETAIWCWPFVGWTKS